MLLLLIGNLGMGGGDGEVAVEPDVPALIAERGGGGGRSGWSEAWRRVHARRRKELEREDEALYAALKALGPEVMRHQPPLH